MRLRNATSFVTPTLSFTMFRKLLPIYSVVLLLAAPWVACAQETNANVETAIQEGIRRQEVKKRMQNKLADAQLAEKRHEVEAAAKAYDQAVEMGKTIANMGVEPEVTQAVAGVIATRSHLAQQAQRRMDLIEADTQIRRMLSVDPRSTQALSLKKDNDERRAALVGMMPNAETLAKGPEIYTNRVKAATLVQDGRFLYENGRLEIGRAHV